MPEKEQNSDDNRLMCNRTKPCGKKNLTAPPQQMYDPCTGPEENLEVDLVGKLPSRNDYTYIVTATDVISGFLYAIPIRRPDTVSTVKAQPTNFTQHAYVL